MSGTSTLPTPAALAIGQSVLPPGAHLQGLQPALLAEIYRDLEGVSPAIPRALNGICAALDLRARLRTGRGIASLPEERRLKLLSGWYGSAAAHEAPLSLLVSLLKLYYFDQPEIFEHHGIPHDKAPSQPDPEPPYMQQARPGWEVAQEGEELEADVVVVGSGAAGAIVAKELAERGHAVLLVEAGRYYRRHDFNGRVLPAFKQFYDWQAWKVALGNVAIPVPAGVTVGGSTTINTATSFRPGDYVFQGWVEQGLPELSRQNFTPHFQQVEAMMQIEPVKPELRGPHVELVARAAEARGYSHGPIKRNAPECDGQNTCDMGCPSGGKFSMDRACVPMALRHGALLLTETRMERVVIRQGRVRGVELSSGGRRFRAAARRVVLCCGALTTPQVLWEMDLGGPAVGRGLTIHPSLNITASFPQVLRGFDSLVPSSYHIDQFKEQRVMLIVINIPPDFGAVPLQLLGPDLMREMERYDHYGGCGVLLAEASRGRMQRLPGGRVVTRYSLERGDVALLQRYLALLCELYFEAGAEAIYPAVRGFPVIRDHDDLARFRRARISAGQMLMSAYHPLGTCRMGRDPRTSVVDPEYRVRGVEGLSIVDGGVVPGPVGVNSQLTVMAFAHRAAPILHRQLEQT